MRLRIVCSRYGISRASCLDRKDIRARPDFDGGTSSAFALALSSVTVFVSSSERALQTFEYRRIHSYISDSRLKGLKSLPRKARGAAVAVSKTIRELVSRITIARDTVIVKFQYLIRKARRKPFTSRF